MGVTLGAIDIPVPGAQLCDEVVHIVGWAARDGRMASSVEVRLDGVRLGGARLGLVRPDLQPFGAEAVAAGFEFHAVLSAAAGTHHVISAVARFDGGTPLLISGPTVEVGSRRQRTAVGDPRPRSTLLARPRGTDTRTRVLAVTHQLDLGGGQLYLQDLVRGLMRTGRFEVTVASCLDGSLRMELEELGVGVHVLGRWPQSNMVALGSRLDEFSAWVREGRFDAVIVNTAIGFPAVSVAARLDIPSLWAIHESYPLPLLFHALLGGSADPDVAALARDALVQADRLIFEAESTRQLYLGAAGEDRCLFVPYGLELDALDAQAARLDRTATRQRLGLPRQGRVLLCMGTFESRKAQTLLIRAFSDVAARHPDATLVLVGDNGSDYAAHVHRLAQATGLGPRIRIAPVAPDIMPWYIAADVLVSASDVESTPRSAIEAMFLRTPVLAAVVYGLSELVEDGVTGWLVAPRDLGALVDGINRVLATPDAEMRRMAHLARERIRRDHDAAGYVATVAGLLDDMVASPRRTAEPTGG